MTIRIDEFFDPPNIARSTDLSPATGGLVQDLAARLMDRPCRTLLPAQVGGNVRWYAVASDGRQSRLLMEEVRSWLGPPIASAASMVVGPADVIDERVLALLPGAMVAQVLVTPGWEVYALNNVERLATSWRLAPERDEKPPRPIGRVLRQFYDAVLARNRPLAEDALAEVQQRSLLSAPNTRFLRVELLASLGTAAELRDHPDLQDITLLSRPPSVTNHLAVAANELIVAPAFSGGDPDIRALAEELEDRWPGLVTHPVQVLSVAGARCLALVEATAYEPREVVAAALRTTWGDDPIVHRVLESLTAAPDTGPAATPVHPIDVIEQESTSGPLAVTIDPLYLVTTGNYAAAIEAIEQAPLAPLLVAAAMHAALNLGEPAYESRALQLVHRLDADERDALLGLAVERSFYDQLVARNDATEIPGGWTAWLSGIGSGRPDLLRSWCAHWGDPADLGESEIEDLVLSLIDALGDERRARARDGLPVFLTWIIGDKGLRPGVVRLALLAVEVMLESDPGPLERQGVLELVDELLDQGCSSEEYSELSRAIEDHLAALGPRDASWVADCVDRFWLSTCPDQPRRAALTSQAFAAVVAWSDRVDPLEYSLLRRVFARAGLELEDRRAAASEDAEERASRGFRSVGIYSLHESASRVASDWIQSEWPGVVVRESHDKVSSDRLEALVRGCDVLLVQTSRASHAATAAINAVAPDPSRVMLVHGRGASALMRALNNWVFDETT